MLIKYNEMLLKCTKTMKPKNINNKTVNNKNNNININNVNNGIINATINIVAFGKENMDFNINEIGKLCQGNKTVPNLINYMHFNESKP